MEVQSRMCPEEGYSMPPAPHSPKQRGLHPRQTHLPGHKVATSPSDNSLLLVPPTLGREVPPARKSGLLPFG